MSTAAQCAIKITPQTNLDEVLDILKHSYDFISKKL
jgi:hypothetical protein